MNDFKCKKCSNSIARGKTVTEVDGVLMCKCNTCKEVTQVERLVKFWEKITVCDGNKVTVTINGQLVDEY